MAIPVITIETRPTTPELPIPVRILPMITCHIENAEPLDMGLEGCTRKGVYITYDTANPRPNRAYATNNGVFRP